MSLKQRIQQKSAAAVKYEIVTLPIAGEQVKVRGMTVGEQMRYGAEAKEKGDSRANIALLAMACLDPDTNTPIWNPNTLEDRQAIEALPVEDGAVLFQAITRLNGGDDVGKTSPGIGNSSSSSPSDSDVPPPSLATD